MYKALLTLVCILSVVVFSEAKTTEIKTDSKITEVTVYQQNALIHREAEVLVPAGSSAIILHELNPEIRPQDVRINAIGDFKILSITYQYNVDTLAGWNEEERKKNIATLITDLQEKIQRENGYLDVYVREEQMLMANQNFAHKEEGVDIDRLAKASDFMRSRLLDIKNIRLSIQDKVKAWQLEINDLNNKLTNIKGLETKTSLEMVIRVNCEKSEMGTFMMDYRVYSAGWLPSYDATVERVTDPLILEYKAKVYQSTGEDWNDIKLTIATGNPNLNKKKPSLLPWYISGVTPQRPPRPNKNNDYNAFLRAQPYNSNISEVRGQVLDASTGESIPFVNIMISGTSTGVNSDFDGNFRIEIPNNGTHLEFSFVGYDREVLPISNTIMNVILDDSSVQLDEAMVISAESGRTLNLLSKSRAKRAGNKALKDARYFEDDAADFAEVSVSYGMTNTRFNIEADYSIPSDGKEYAVQIQRHEMNASYVYKCSPKLDLSAYLTAEITEWEDYNLLNGPMNIYFEKSFVGQSQLDLTNARDTLSLSLGEDKGISIVRTRVKAENKKQVLGSSKKVIREWEFTVRNNKREPITLIIDDQLPITTTEDIEVEAQSISGGKINSLTGRVTWDLDLESGKEKRFNFKYSVKFPKSMYLKL